MQAIEIIDAVSASGGMLWLEGDKVRGRLPESLRPLVSLIRERKHELVELLEQRPVMPAGVRLLSYLPMTPPIQVSPSETVTDIEKFIRTSLVQLQAALEGRNWIAGNWGLSGLLARLEACGCIVALDDPRRALQ